jgi:acyl carrier protein
MSAPTRPELLVLFQKTATEIVEKDFSTLAETAKLSDLGIDSLGMLEIIGSLERQLHIQIPDDALTGLATVADLIGAVEKRFSLPTA